MIKIDWAQFIRAYVWFGWMLDDWPLARPGPIWIRLESGWYRYRIVRVRPDIGQRVVRNNRGYM